MNGDRIPKALEALRSAIRSLMKANNADPRRTISHLAAALDSTATARDALSLEYEQTIDHLHTTLAQARQKEIDRDPSKH